MPARLNDAVTLDRLIKTWNTVKKINSSRIVGIKLMRSISRLKENKIFKAAIIKAIPIMCSYFFVSMAYGMMMQKAGFAWYYFIVYKPYGLYRGISVRSDNIFKQRSILSYHSCHCIVDEQQAVVLFGNICRGF